MSTARVNTAVHLRRRRPGPDHITGEAVAAAVAEVCDPEYPDISIVDLGMLESIEIADDRVTVGLVPTFSGCPALSMIAGDVDAVVTAATGRPSTVRWLPAPTWSTDRITASARRALREDYTVTIRRPDAVLVCPVCGSDEVVDQSMAGPTRCRSVAWCPACRNVIEVMR